jgi:hypothetical protein
MNKMKTVSLVDQNGKTGRHSDPTMKNMTKTVLKFKSRNAQILDNLRQESLFTSFFIFLEFCDRSSLYEWLQKRNFEHNTLEDIIKTLKITGVLTES